MTRIIAKETDMRWGFRKGDILEIVESPHGGPPGMVCAKNLTVPCRYGREYAILASDEYEYAADIPTIIYEFKILGIPIFRKTVREGIE